MESNRAASVRQACEEFLSLASSFYKVLQPGIRVLAARPLRVREGGSSIELFGDYSPETMVSRLWIRTAIRKQVTSFGTFFSTLCHEFCHHLDCQRFGFPESWHTRGFYERTAALYHHTRGTPAKRLFWVRMPGERWRIDWPRTLLARSTNWTDQRPKQRPCPVLRGLPGLQDGTCRSGPERLLGPPLAHPKISLDIITNHDNLSGWKSKFFNWSLEEGSRRFAKYQKLSSTCMF